MQSGTVIQNRSCFYAGALHVWQEHFVTNHFPELWDLLKGWVRLKETTEFDEQWVQIKKLAPPSLI